MIRCTAAPQKKGYPYNQGVRNHAGYGLPKSGTKGIKMNSMKLRPELKMLEQGDCLQIHQASCEILEKTGVEIHNPEGVRLLRDAGAVVTDGLVKISPSLIEQALASVPSSFNLYQRGTDKVAVRLDGEAVYFGSGS
ncbi:MAG: hypothetical protein EHM41_23240, partial [Chloroflexi bacterium]